MALLNTRSSLTTPSSGDLIHVVDVLDTTSDPTGTSKKITHGDLKSSILTGLLSSDVANTPAGDITATDVQAAINELDSEKEPNITAATSADYYRGDKTFATLDKAAVGLANVDNTSDANKPVSTAQQAALDLKQDILTEGAFVDGDKTKLDGIEAGAEVNNISDVNATDLTDGGETSLHIHDGRYYTETETDSLLNNKQDQDNLLDDISTLSGNGIIVRVNANTAASRSIVAGSGKITVTNGDGTSSNPSIDIGSGIDATSIADGSVSNTEFQYINSLSSNAQTQIDSKLDHTGGTITDYAETVSDVTATATTSLDINNGNVFNLTQAVDITTFNFNNAATSGSSSSFTLIRTKDATTTARAIAWPTSVKWSSGVVPALSTASSAVDIFTFMTIDGGTTWYGFLGGQQFS